LYGRAQRYLHEVKSEVSREIELDELRNLKKEVEETAQTIRSGVENAVKESMDDVDSAWRDLPSSTTPTATMSDLERKARDFRRKKLVRNSAIPGWYKQRHGGKSHIMSGAARVKKYRPSASPTSSFF
jgi:sec-independent protein translocase protein TatB